MLSATGICVLPNTNSSVLNALRPVPKRYKGASLSLKLNLIRVTPMTLNLPLWNCLSYCYNLSFFHEGSLEAFHILVKCSWSQSLLKVPLIMSLLWCKIELLLQCVLYPGKAKPFPQLTEVEGLKNKWIKEDQKEWIFIKKGGNNFFLKCRGGKLKQFFSECLPDTSYHCFKRERDWWGGVNKSEK